MTYLSYACQNYVDCWQIDGGVGPTLCDVGVESLVCADILIPVDDIIHTIWSAMQLLANQKRTTMSVEHDFS